MRRHCRSRRPFDRNRVTTHRGGVLIMGDFVRFAVDTGFKQAVHRIHEVEAVGLGVETEDARSKQPFDQFGGPGTDREDFGVWPRDMPERDDRRFG